MKRLQEHEPYPAELWEETDAPTWSPERVWQQIETQHAAARPKRKWLFWWCMLALVLGSIRWLTEEQVSTVPVEILPEVSTYTPSIPLQPTEVQLRTSVVEEELPETAILPKLPEHRSFQLESPVSPPRVLPLENQDTTATTIPIPIAQEEWLPQTPIAPVMSSPLQLLPESVAELPADARPGTKLKLKIPEIPSADARQGAFAKRLWQQYKRLNTEGEIDWVELGIQPNGDGTFSILPKAPKNNSKPN